MTIGGFMERKELLKKLNELKRSVVAISLASTVVLGASACSNEEKPYFSEELSMEDYFNSHDEENCFMTYYIDNNKVDGKTFEEWNSIYKEARCSAIYDEKTNKYKPSSENSEIIMNRALYSMGLLILKGQIIESLNIMPGNVKDIKVISSSKEADYRAHISYTTYETKKATGNIDTKVMTEKNISYSLTGAGKDVLITIVDAGDQCISTSHNLNDYDNAYQQICEFMLYKGTPDKNILGDNYIKFNLDPVKVNAFNEEHNKEYQKTMNKGE